MRERRWNLVLLVLATLVVCEGAPTHPEERPDIGPLRNAVVFQSTEDGGRNEDLYALDLDSEEVTRLTSYPGWDGRPSVSPDGTRVAFDRARGEQLDVHVLHLDGTGLDRITDHPVQDWDPDWSPDGRHLVFVSDRHDPFDPLDPERKGSTALFIVLADGSEGPEQLTSFPSAQPAWSPDGERIAFAGRFDGNWDVWTVRPDGNGLARLTSDPGVDRHPAWSSDGSRIVFERGTEIAVMNRDGTGARTLTDWAGSDQMPAWGPGEQILFSSTFQTNGDGLHVLEPDTGERRVLWNPPIGFPVLSPVWSPR